MSAELDGAKANAQHVAKVGFPGNYSEHVDVLQTLQDNKVVGEVVRNVKFGPFDSYACEVPLLNIDDWGKL